MNPLFIEDAKVCIAIVLFILALGFSGNDDIEQAQGHKTEQVK